MKPSSFCTICTQNCSQELVGFLLTLSIHHTNANVYVMCDTKTKSDIDEMTPKIRLNITYFVDLDKYSNLNRAQMEQLGVWSDFQMAKAQVIEKALAAGEKDTLFLDSDIIILDTIDGVDMTKQLGVSPQFIQKKNVDETGYYNGGMLWTNQKTLPADWIEFTKTSRYYDQASIEDLVAKYDHFEFGENYNLQTWRFIVGLEDAKTIASYLNLKVHAGGFGKIHYKDKPLKFIHTHFNNNRFESINKFFVEMLTNANYYKELACINRLINKRWFICIPKQPRKDIYNHTNDSFRELAVLWRVKNKDVEIAYNEKKHVWLQGGILLYDRPTMLWARETDRELYNATQVYLGNGSLRKEGKDFYNMLKYKIKPWIFWPRRPMILEKVLKDNPPLPYDKRDVETVFIGNIENNVQANYRMEHRWDTVLQEYHCTKGNKHKFTQKEYLLKLRQSKYGLCLRGYGSKCHREVELMAFGTVPIITPEVSIKDYLDPPVEDMHYIRAITPTQLMQKIRSISPEQWNKMSEACVKWYKKNVHSDHSWIEFIDRVLYD